MRGLTRVTNNSPAQAQDAAPSASQPTAAHPDVDGPLGWMMVAAAFLSLYSVFGVSYSFAAFFGSMADEFDKGRGAIAFFFALTTFLYFGLGVISGKVADRVGPRPVMLFGSACLVLGLLATSRVDSLFVGYLTYGLGVGIGVACGYVPVVAAVGGWFEAKRTTAIGISVAGIGVGTLVNVPIAEWLIDRYGWRDTYVIMAAGAAVLLTIAALLAKRPPAMGGEAEAPKLGSIVAGSKPFWLLYISMAILTVPLFLPFVFLSDYLEVEGSTRSAGLLLGVIGLSSVVGRLGVGALESRIPVVRLYQGSVLVMALSYLIWISAGDSYNLLLVFAIVMGVSYGGFIALAPAVTAEVFGPVGLGAILGALYTAAGLGGFVGPPAMGWLIDAVGYQASLAVAMAFGGIAVAILLPLQRFLTAAS